MKPNYIIAKKPELIKAEKGERRWIAATGEEAKKGLKKMMKQFRKENKII